MTIRKLLTAFCLSAAILSSCEKTPDDKDILLENNIPQNIINDFSDKYRDVKITDAGTYSYDGHTFIDFINVDNLKCQSIYKNDEWLITTRVYPEENFVESLPLEVRKSFLGLGYDHPRFDIVDNTNRVMEITRRGINHQVYDFRFHIELKNGSFAQVQVMISEDGLVLINSRDGYNKQELFWWNDNDEFNFIYGKYRTPDILSYANYGGRHNFIIMDDGIIKTVSFSNADLDSEAEWDETVYEFNPETMIPDNVMAQYELWKTQNPEYGEFIYDTVLFKEHRSGNNYYGLRDTTREDNLTVWFPSTINQ